MRVPDRARSLQRQRPPRPELVAKKSPHFRDEIHTFAAKIAHEVGGRLAVEAFGHGVDAALTTAGLQLANGNEVLQRAMAIEQPLEIEAMRRAMTATQTAARHMETAIAGGMTEQAVWAEFHRGLIAGGGEINVGRLLRAGDRKFPSFQEASAHKMRGGDLVCFDFDSDADAADGYSVDFPRTFLCGDMPPSDQQRHLYVLALGLGMTSGHPNVPHVGTHPYPLPGCFEPGMVICVESYVGDSPVRRTPRLSVS